MNRLRHRHVMTCLAVAGAWVTGVAVFGCGSAAAPDPTVQCIDPPEVGVTAGTGSTAPADSVPATVDRLTVTPCLVDVSGGLVMVTFVGEARSGVGLDEFSVYGTTPTGARPVCGAGSPVAGTRYDGRWQCGWVLDRYAAPGEWRLRAGVRDTAWQETVEVMLTVSGAAPDANPPTLTEIRYPPERLTIADQETRSLTVGGVDAESGMWRIEIYGLQDDPGLDWSCAAEVGVWPDRPSPPPDVWQVTADYAPACPVFLVDRPGPVFWTITVVRLVDHRGNRRVYEQAELEAAGVLTRFDVAK